VSATTAGIGTPPKPRGSFRSWLANPWAETRFLWVFAIGYVLWSLVPVAEAVLFSFNKSRSITQWSGFSMRWYTGDPTGSVLHNPELQHAIVQSVKLATLTVVIAVPLAVAFALALHRWRGRGSASSNFVMLFSFVTPELILAVSLFLLMTQLSVFRSLIGLGTLAQVVGLVVLALAYPVIIVRARLLSLGNSYEEAGMDLGASPVRTLGRVTLPLLGPSIFASAAIIFAITLDDFVIVEQLSKNSANQTVAMAIYEAVRTQPTPAANAIGTIMLVTSTIVIVVAATLYRRASRKTGDVAPPLTG
jgi:spermidine/putrescine transport system permease protein